VNFAKILLYKIYRDDILYVMHGLQLSFSFTSV